MYETIFGTVVVGRQMTGWPFTRGQVAEPLRRALPIGEDDYWVLRSPYKFLNP